MMPCKLPTSLLARVLVALLTVTLFGSCSSSSDSTEPPPPPGPRDQWTEAEAAEWYAKQPWLLGANFLPSNAVNQLEMWQPDTYDEDTIDRELAWAADLGFNTMRVFLHDLLWEADPEGFLDRIDSYLAISDSHGISTMLVFFDGVWNPNPVAGPQPAPIPHVHNSQWVQSPGAEILDDPSRYDDLEPYVKGVIERFRTDSRVVVWDLFNEPDNPNPVYHEVELDSATKTARATALLEKAFEWAREVGPVQPITAGVFKGDWSDPESLDEINRLMLTESDVNSFHTYQPPSITSDWIADLQQYGRPILCTEYLSRPDNRFQDILPIFKAEDIAGYNWGLVNGKSQTNYSWTSWVTMDPNGGDPWFHDILRPDGTAFDPEEVAFIREIPGTD